MASTMKFSDSNVVTRPGREVPKFYRDIINILIDQGWRYEPGRRANKGSLIPPDPTKKIVTVASTPSASSSAVVWVGKLRNSGAILDEEEIAKMSRRVSRDRLRQSVRATGQSAAMPADAADIEPITTHGAWWRSSAAQTEIPVEAPETPAEEVRKPRRYEAPPLAVQARYVGPDAQGANYSLTQAYALLRQGYHVNKVVAKTGWGPSWFKDMIGPSGYHEPGS